LSRSVRQYFDPLRKTGATAREMLVAAAARRWKVEPSTCRAEAGSVVHVPSGRKLGYGALAAAAAREEVPKDPPLKEPKDWKLIGTKVPRLDTPDKTRGRARFGIDVRIPGLRFAAVARPPVVGGKVLRYDAAKAKAVPGVRSVVEVPSGVAVVADSTWRRSRDATRSAPPSIRGRTAGSTPPRWRSSSRRRRSTSPRGARATSTRRSRRRRSGSRRPTTCRSSRTRRWSR
jgi:isoquinoline 1-oxidoreductase beta subunit